MTRRFILAAIILAVFVSAACGDGEPSSPAAADGTIAIPTKLQGTDPTVTARAALDAIQATNARNSAAAATAVAPKLVIISWDCSTDAGYITCEGFVQNISQSAIKNVTAVIAFEDETGTPVSSDHALIEYDPLLANQTSPFKVLTRYNPGFKKASLEFKELFGGKIASRDDSISP